MLSTSHQELSDRNQVTVLPHASHSQVLQNDSLTKIYQDSKHLTTDYLLREVLPNQIQNGGLSIANEEQLPRQSVSDQSNSLCTCFSSVQNLDDFDEKFYLTKYLRNTRFKFQKQSVTRFQKVKLTLQLLPRSYCAGYHINSLKQFKNLAFKISIIRDKTIQEINTYLIGGEISCDFVPVSVGSHKLELREMTHSSYIESRLYIDFFTVKQINPEFCFNHGEACPVSLATESGIVYVAYYDHLCSFTKYGEILSVLVQLLDAYINDIAVNAKFIVLAVSGWKKEDANSYRFQEIRIYDIKGAFIHAFGWDPPLFANPVLRVAITPNGQVIVPDKDTLHVFDLIEQTLLGQTKSKNLKLNFASRVRSLGSNIFILDSADNCIKVLDKDYQLTKQIKLHVENNSAKSKIGNGFTGSPNKTASNITASSFCIDTKNGTLLVTDSINGHVSVYDLDNCNYLGKWANTWLPLKWPLDIEMCAVTGAMYVVDHGNNCVFAYTMT